jgi:D-glycero-D-manno-heptose 1,7-bisphosphate phosphatase
MFRDGGALFLDRDGTIVEENGYVTSPDQLRLLPNAAAAITRFHEAGIRIFVITNQAAVAHGLIDERELEAINLRLVALLGAEGARVDGFYCCPHHPEGKIAEYAQECDCRKPAPGLLERASREHDIVLWDSVMVGDSLRDLQAGRSAGTKAALVRTGYGAKLGTPPEADWIFGDLLEAASALL